MPIKNLPLHLRPREKALEFGVEKLTDIELLALFLRSGNAQSDVLSISKELLSHFNGFDELTFATVKELKQIKGIGPIKALELVSIFEIIKRINISKSQKSVKGVEEIAKLAINQIGSSKQEKFLLYIVDRSKALIAQKNLFIGQKDTMEVDPKIIVSHVIKAEARQFYCIHNHPSGDHQYSDADKLFTTRLNHYCEIFDLKLLGHIVVSEKGYSIIMG